MAFGKLLGFESGPTLSFAKLHVFEIGPNWPFNKLQGLSDHLLTLYYGAFPTWRVGRARGQCAGGQIPDNCWVHSWGLLFCERIRRLASNMRGHRWGRCGGHNLGHSWQAGKQHVGGPAGGTTGGHFGAHLAVGYRQLAGAELGQSWGSRLHRHTACTTTARSALIINSRYVPTIH